MRVPFGAITIASMLSGAVCERLLKITLRLVISWPVKPETAIVDGYGLAFPFVPEAGIAIGVVFEKRVGTVRSSRRKTDKSDRWMALASRRIRTRARRANFFTLFRMVNSFGSDPQRAVCSTKPVLDCGVT